VKCIRVIRGRLEWLTSVNTVIKLRVPYKAEILDRVSDYILWSLLLL
jgi:hypothetical protein